MTIGKSEIQVAKGEVITIPKWILMYLIPFLTSLITFLIAYNVFTAQMRMEIAELKKDNIAIKSEIDKKVNAAEVNLQFMFIIDDLKIIKAKLNGASEKLDRNEQTTIDARR